MSQNQSTDSVGFLGAAILFIACWAFWHFFHHPVTEAFRWLRYGELWLIGKIVSNQYVSDWSRYLGDRRSHVEWANIGTVTGLVGHYLRYPTAAILLVFAYFSAFKAPKSAFKKTYSLDRLIAAQAKIWPVIAPVVGFNPAEHNARDPDARDPIPADLPVFAEALSPDEWLRWHKIAPYDTQEHEHTNDLLDRESTFYAFAEQLGPRWRGPAALPWHAKGLFAAFALKTARKREEADALLGEMATSIRTRRNSMTLIMSSSLRRRITKIIEDPKIGGEAAKIAARHAYVAPALLRLLEHARERGGVLAPAQFVWLRGVNRTLWYPLNNLGRQSFHTEAAGAIAHFHAEKAATTPLFSPKVDNAVTTLEEYTRMKQRGTVPALIE